MTSLISFKLALPKSKLQTTKIKKSTGLGLGLARALVNITAQRLHKSISRINFSFVTRLLYSIIINEYTGANDKLYTEYLIREALEDGEGININGQHITNIRYADDTIILAESEQQLQHMIDKLDAIWYGNECQEDQNNDRRENT